MSEISFDDFMAVDIRVGEITRAEPFPEARKPAYKLWVNFGNEIGEKKSSAKRLRSGNFSNADINCHKIIK